MHYILPTKLLKKKYKGVGEGPSSCPELKKLEDLAQLDFEEDKEMQRLEWKKIATLR
jgi:hypothetical protein